MALFNHDKQTPLQMMACLLFQAAFTIWILFFILGPVIKDAPGSYNPSCLKARVALEEILKEIKP